MPKSEESSPAITEEETPTRGRAAKSPKKIPPKGWKDIALRVWMQIWQNHLSVTAGGVAFFWFLSLFPLLIALFSLFGLVADPAQVQRQVSQFASGLPPEAHELLVDEMSRLAGQAGGALGWGAVAGLAFAVWSASKGVKSMMQALNIVYSEKEDRGMVGVNLIGLVLTVVIIVMCMMTLGVIIALPIAMNYIGLAAGLEAVIQLVTWGILLTLVISVLSLLYRWAPNRKQAKWKWITPGALVASFIWLVGSWAFSFFIQNFGNYSNTFGSLAAVIILILWFFMSALIILIGGEINGEAERQTRKDSTVGEPKPMGERGAYVADTLGK